MRPHLATLVEDFRRHGAQIAIVQHRGNRSYRTSYEELALLAGRFAAALDSRGVVTGQRVVIWGENSAEWTAAFFGCVMRGVIAVPLDAAGSISFVERVVEDTKPELIVGNRGLFADLLTQGTQLAFEDFQHALPVHPLREVSSSVTSETPFQIVFTSGTTSEPKGIVHTHRNVLASLEPIEREMGKYKRYERWVHPLRFLHTLPLSHVFGQFMGIWIPPLLVAEVHFDSQLESGRIVATVHRERISVLVAVPRVLELLRAYLLGHFPELNAQLRQAEGLPVWKRWWVLRRVHRTFGIKFWAVVCGGATLPPELEKFWNTLGFALVQGYGMTETSALVTLNHPFKVSTGTIGKALPGREVKLSAEGELLVRGDMLSAATWQNGRLHPRTDEWLATGDLAEQGASGDFHFVGRKGDVIVSASGMNIHPADLEKALMQQKVVRGAVVVPCETTAGTDPVAVVLLNHEDDSELQPIASAANKLLASHQQIRRILRWPEMSFPYTSTGKLLRRHVAQWACAQISAASPSPANAWADALLRMISEVTGENNAEASDSSRLTEDLHLDSLGRVQLQSSLEQRLGIELNDDALARMETLRDLRSAAGEMAVENPDRESMPGQASTEASVLQSKSASKRKDVGISKGPGHIYPHWPWSWPVRVLRVVFVEIVMRPLVRLLAAPTVEGDGPLPNGPFLIISNHVSTYDGPLVLYALPAHLRRHVAVAMSGEMLLDFRKARGQGNWLFNALAPAAYLLITALFNVFPLPRLRGFRRSFAHAGEALDSGQSVLVFPEGHRSDTGRLQHFRSGIGLLARESEVPVLPVALKGLGEMKNGRRRWFRSGRLSVRIGRPIDVDRGSDPAELTRRFEAAVTDLLGVD